MALYYAGNHRTAEQLAEMRRLERDGVCVFCAPYLGGADEQRIVHRTDWWSVTPNRYPYRGTKLHLLLVPSVHVNDMLDLPREAQADFWNALGWVRDHYALTFYGLGVRCGPCEFTGGTIEHLHAHVIVGDVDNPDHTPVRLKLSSRPEGDLAE